MKSKRFENAISALVEAFFSGTLAKGSCCACAVGNIIHKSFGVKPIIEGETYEAIATYPSKCPVGGEWYEIVIGDNDNLGVGMEQINATGFSLQEIINIENAFEVNTTIGCGLYSKFSKSEIMEDQYKGLMAVVDVLCEIEGLDYKEYKELFAYETH